MTDLHPEELMMFLNLLLEDVPDEYNRWLFRVEAGSKARTSTIPVKKERARLTKQETIQWMNSGGNVGIAGTPDDPLVNVDIDDEDEMTTDNLKQTLIARPHSRTGVHAWCLVTGDRDIQNIPTEEPGEVRTDWQYMIAPGSYAETDPSDVPGEERDMANYYTVKRGKPVASLTFDQLPEVFKREVRDEDSAEVDVEQMPGSNHQPATEGNATADIGSGQSRSALFEVSAEDVASWERGRVSEDERWTATFHGNETDKNMPLSSEGLLHCWRHEVAHN